MDRSEKSGSRSSCCGGGRVYQVAVVHSLDYVSVRLPFFDWETWTGADFRGMCDRSQRYTDPALQAVLETSLTADNNELFLTNLVNKQVMGIHGYVSSHFPEAELG